MKKVEIITQLIVSLNIGNATVYSSVNERVEIALMQYNRMVKLGIVKEEEENVKK